ncbi:hypothetical protein ECP030481613_5141 [Escherichia coli P0304816.13]|nr:hypothetical protein ECP030481613_5141 [Escherichia coli P0304816.13]
MARRQILSQSERESLLALPDDELTLTRMAYFSEHDLALINAHRKPASRFGFAVLLCYLKNVGFAPDKKTPPSDALLKPIANRLKLADGLWSSYINGRETTRREHLTELYRYLGVKAFTNKIQQSCITHLLPMATRTTKAFSWRKKCWPTFGKTRLCFLRLMLWNVPVRKLWLAAIK